MRERGARDTRRAEGYGIDEGAQSEQGADATRGKRSDSRRRERRRGRRRRRRKRRGKRGKGRKGAPLSPSSIRVCRYISLTSPRALSASFPYNRSAARRNGRKKERYHADSITLSPAPLPSRLSSLVPFVGPGRALVTRTLSRSSRSTRGPLSRLRRPSPPCALRSDLSSSLSRAVPLFLLFILSRARHIGPFHNTLSLSLASLYPFSPFRLPPLSFSLPLPPKLQACESTVPCNCYLGNDLASSFSLFTRPFLLSSISLSLSPLARTASPPLFLVLSPRHAAEPDSATGYIRAYIHRREAQVHRSAVGKSLTLPRI